MKIFKIEKKRPFIAIIGLLGLACGQPSVEKTRAKPPQKMVFTGPGKMLVEETSGWKIVSNPRYFGPENLYDLINGGAEIYREFGLKKMVTADYKSEKREGLTVTVEVYDQGTLTGAFGRMARFLEGRADPSDAGKGLPSGLADRGLFGGSDLVFYKDHYLVHITLLDESPSATAESITQAGRQVLPGFADVVAAKIKADPPPPVELASFPAKHRIARSDGWNPLDVAGIKGLGPGFTVRYKSDEASFTLFATEKHKDPAAIEQKAIACSKELRDKEKSAFAKAGRRIIGFITNDETWSKKTRKIADAQMEALKNAFESP